MSNQREVYSWGGWGQALDSGQPAGQLAELNLEHKATPQRLAAARSLFTEAQLSDFEAVGNRGRKWRHKDTGREYLLDASQVLMSTDPRRLGIEYFIVYGDRLMFLRARGFDASERGIPGEVISGERRQSPGGGVRVVDASTGAVVREGLRL